MQVWHEFYTMSGAASASLTGLVVVALSMHRDVIARHSGYRSVALQTVIAFITILMVAALELVPTQSLTAFGIELVVGGLGGVLASALIQLAARKGLLGYRQGYLRIGVAYNLVLMVIAVSGLLIAFGAVETGLLLLAPAVIVLGVLAITNSYILVMHVQPLAD